MLRITAPKALGHSIIEAAISAKIDSINLRQTSARSESGDRIDLDVIELYPSLNQRKLFLHRIMQEDFYDASITILEKRGKAGLMAEIVRDEQAASTAC